MDEINLTETPVVQSVDIDLLDGEVTANKESSDNSTKSCNIENMRVKEYVPKRKSGFCYGCYLFIKRVFDILSSRFNVDFMFVDIASVHIN